MITQEGQKGCGWVKVHLVNIYVEFVYWDAFWAFLCFNWDRVCIYDARGRSFLPKTLKPSGNQHTYRYVWVIGHRYTASSEWCNLLCGWIMFSFMQGVHQLLDHGGSDITEVDWWQVSFVSTKTTDECFLPPSCAHVMANVSVTKVTFPAMTRQRVWTTHELIENFLISSCSPLTDCRGAI